MCVLPNFQASDLVFLKQKGRINNKKGKAKSVEITAIHETLLENLV